jgi:hypothetical protein
MAPMRVILYDGRARRDSEPLIAHTARHLGRFGIRLERVRAGRRPRRPWDAYTALMATADYPLELRERIACYGKASPSPPSRPDTLGWLHEAGLPVMRWSLAADHREVDRLFDAWRTDALLLKRSDTFGGTSVALFTRDRIAELEWDPQRDVFCPEVNPGDGDIYKLELFGSTLLLGWKSRVPPARERLRNGIVQGLYGAYGVRELFDWQESILRAARRSGQSLLDRGHGHISLDFMRNPAGGFEAIEVNLGNVAVWWTTQFPRFRQAYASAVHRMLVDYHDASAVPAAAAFRFGNWLSATVRRPKLLVREAQGAWYRRRTTAEFEKRHAAGLRVASRGR